MENGMNSCVCLSLLEYLTTTWMISCNNLAKLQIFISIIITPITRYFSLTTIQLNPIYKATNEKIGHL